MENAFFPGYGRCIACQELVPKTDFHNHTLNCRAKSTNEKIICSSCNQSVDFNLFKQHIENCKQNTDDEDNNQGYQTPRAQTPIQNEKTPQKHKIDQSCSNNQVDEEENIPKKKVCGICKQQIDLSQYRNHVTSCSPNRSSLSLKDQNRSNSTESSIQISKPNDLKNKATKICSLCKQQIDQSDFANHIQSCSPNQVDEEENIPKRKVCGLCKQQIDVSEYRNHVASCSTNRSSSLPEHDNRASSTKSSIEISKQNDLKNKATKICSLCKQQIDQSDFANHIQSCSTNQVDEEENIPKRKVCGICKQQIDVSEYRNHVASCSTNRSTLSFEDQNRSSSMKSSIEIPKQNDLKNKTTKLCGLCKQEIDLLEYRNHVASCSRNRSSPQNDKHSSNKTRNKTKFCTLCSESFDESEYNEHVQFCSNDNEERIDHRNKNRSNNNRTSFQIDSRQTKRCGLCKQEIDLSEYVNHVGNCSSGSSSRGKKNFDRDDFQRNSFDQITTSDHFTKNEKTRRDCFICYKSIDQSEFEDHVQACAAELDKKSSISTRNNKQTCFICNHPIKKEDKNSYEILCHSRHNYCLTCLRESMEEFARTRQTPVCHRTLCDYELSRHDISSIPLERHLSNRLLKLAKGEQRPYCSKCHFYVHINENESFDEHFETCGDLIPCEYCELPFPFNQLEDHAIQCRNDPTSFNEKLINFILPRTKYPFTKEQIRIFIQNHRHKSDPVSIIEALAVFGSTFPYEIPTRECGICMESRPYDDIYVFDCDESHKICYDCYYQSCQAKMNAGEILTCALCEHPLRDGELNQLRIPYDQLKIIREYQMKKTFDSYSNRTRGIIKCPNQNCNWVAEAEDPNDRFKVQCPKCMKEFCSLCNQQYHYRTTCQQLPQITQRWFFWCETERQRYLTMRVQQDAQYANQLDEYNRQSKENNDRNKDLRRRYDELMNDEQYKSQNCRLCPSCKRVVQRLEGCDSMICGQDAHGGNVQSGCGAKFNWAQATPYTAAATQQPRQAILDLPKPDNPVVHHDGVTCDQCQNEVNGIRFDCVHCPALTFCEKCEQEATLNHSRENQAYEQQQHVFKLIMVPEEEATQF